MSQGLMTTSDMKRVRLCHATKAGDLAIVFAQATRLGSETDAPEGTRYVQMSDTLAREVEAWLCQLALNLRQ